MQWLLGFAGLLLVVLVGSEAFEVMLLPRRVRRSLRFVRIFFVATWKVWSGIARRTRATSFRDSFLSLYGPLSMVLLLSSWACALILGLGLVQWAIQNRSAPHPLGLLSAIYFSGTSFFTVGYGDVLPTTHLSKGIAVFEAGIGLAFIAVTIGYLPVLYQLFSSRESQVLKLDARAGSPPTATSLLCRHAEGEAVEELYSFLHDWEQWCAVLVESHLSYPMLSYYRSQHDNQSWLSAITSVMDCCALLLTGFAGIKTFAARMTFAMGRLALVELCRVFHLRTGPGEGERLPSADFQQMRQELFDTGLVFSDESSAEEKLSAFRATYEPFVSALAKHFMLKLPPWLPASDVDNWQRSSRGRSAKKLVESAPAQPQ